MAERMRQVCPQLRSKSDVHDALAAGWTRIIAKVKKGNFADKFGVDGRQVGRWIGGENSPELHTALNSLLIDPTALDEVAALYGVSIVPRNLAAANDMGMISELAHLTGQWAEVMADGIRDHNETLALAVVLRDLIPRLQSVVAEADRHRGVAS